MFESCSIGRVGVQIGRARRSRNVRGDNDEARKRRSDAARLRGSYRYTKYDLTLPPAFSKHEANADRGGGSPASPLASTSCSCYHVGFGSLSFHLSFLHVGIAHASCADGGGHAFPHRR
jgi:hypothetical protein